MVLRYAVIVDDFVINVIMCDVSKKELMESVLNAILVASETAGIGMKYENGVFVDVNGEEE